MINPIVSLVYFLKTKTMKKKTEQFHRKWPKDSREIDIVETRAYQTHISYPTMTGLWGRSACHTGFQ